MTTHEKNTQDKINSLFMYRDVTAWTTAYLVSKSVIRGPHHKKQLVCTGTWYKVPGASFNSTGTNRIPVHAHVTLYIWWYKRWFYDANFCRRRHLTHGLCRRVKRGTSLLWKKMHFDWLEESVDILDFELCVVTRSTSFHSRRPSRQRCMHFNIQVLGV